MERDRRLGGKLLLAAFPLLCVLLELRLLFVDDRIVIFKHDWTIPSTTIALRSMLWETLEPWLSNGLGMPNVYGFVYPLSLAWLAASLITAPEPLVAFTLCVALGIGMFAITVTLAVFAPESSPFARAAAALTFAVNPYVVNELGAGHVAELVAYAGLACLLAVIARENNVFSYTQASRLALCVVIAAVQPQYGVFALCMILLATARRVIALRTACGAIALTTLCELGVILPVFAARGMHTLTVDHVTLHWEAAQSRTMEQAFAGFGYASHYVEDLYGTWATPLCSVFAGMTLCALIALFIYARRGNALAGVLVLIASLAVVLAAGTMGPLAPLLLFAFSHIDAFAFFRELYHLEAPVVLTASIGIGCILASLPARLPGAAALLALVLLDFPMLTGHAVAGPRLSHAHERAMLRIAAIIAGTPGVGRVLYLPLRQPMGERGRIAAGTDPDAFPIGDHGAIAEFQPDPLGEHIAWLLRDHRRLPVLAAYGVQFIVDRPGWISRRFSIVEPILAEVTRHCVPTHADIMGLERVADEGDIVLYRNPFYHAPDMPITTKPAKYGALPAPASQSDDPREGWVDGARWAGCFPELGAVPTRTLFTLGERTLKLKVNGSMRTLWLWAPGGAFLDDGRRPRPIVAEHFTPIVLAHARYVVLHIQRMGAVTGLSDEARVDAWADAFASARRVTLWARTEITRPPLLRTNTAVAISSPGEFPTVFDRDASYGVRVMEPARYAQWFAFLMFATLLVYNGFYVFSYRQNNS